MKRTPLRRKTPLKRRRAKPRRTEHAVPLVPLVPRAEVASWIERGMPMGTLTGAVFYLNPEPPQRRRTKYASRARNLDYMRWVKTLPCALARPLDKLPPEWLGGLSPCPAAYVPTEAHHAGRRALGRKASDDTCIPLCSFHHAALTDRRKPFRGWPRGAVKAWELAMVEIYRRRYAERAAGSDAGLY